MSDEKQTEEGAEPRAGEADSPALGESPESATPADPKAPEGEAQDKAQAKAEATSGTKPKAKSKSKTTTAADAAAAVDAEAEDRMDLPKWNRARVKRKQVKGTEQDAFQKSVRTAGRAAITRAPVVLGLIVLVAAMVAGVVWWQDRQQEKRATATRMLAQAVGFRARAEVADVEALTKDRKRPFPVPLVGDEQERQRKVNEALQELQEQASQSPAAELVPLVEAAQAMEHGKFEDATQRYRAFAQEHPDHELVFIAEEGVVLGLEAQGDLEGALEATDALVGSEGDFYRDQGLWHRARLLEAAGKPDEALEVYRQYAQEFPLEKSSIPREKVIARLQELAPDLVPESTEEGPGGGIGLPGGLQGLGLP